MNAGHFFRLKNKIAIAPKKMHHEQHTDMF